MKVSTGTIFVRSLKSGNYLYYRDGLTRKIHSSGLLDNPTNRKIIKNIIQSKQLDAFKDEGILLDDRVNYINDVIEKHLLYLHQNDFAKGTIKLYKQSYVYINKTNYDINKVAFKQGKTTYHKVYNEVELNLILNENLSNMTKLSKLRQLQAFLNWAYDTGYLKTKINLTKLKPKVKEKEPKQYTDDELKMILEAIRDTKEREFINWFEFMLLTGVRVTESLKLSFKDIDYNTNTIKFHNKTKRTKLEYIPLSDKVKKIIEEQKKYNTEKIFKWNENSGRRFLHKKLTKIEEKLGIKEVGRCIHAIRSNYAQMLINNNLSIYEIKDLMRHSDIKTTMIHYKKYNNEALKTKIDKIETF